MKHILFIWKAVRQTFQGTLYKGIFFVVGVLMFSLFILIPVLVVPGNSFLFQMSLFTPQDFILLTVLSFLNALFITMQIYAMRMTRNISASIGGGMSGSAGTLFAGIAGSAFCASCLAPFFAFFGIGFSGVIFTLQYRFYFVAAIAAFILVAIYLTSKKIMRVCADCA